MKPAEEEKKEVAEEDFDLEDKDGIWLPGPDGNYYHFDFDMIHEFVDSNLRDRPEEIHEDDILLDDADLSLLPVLMDDVPAVAANPAEEEIPIRIEGKKNKEKK